MDVAVIGALALILAAVLPVHISQRRTLDELAKKIDAVNNAVNNVPPGTPTLSERLDAGLSSIRREVQRIDSRTRRQGVAMTKHIKACEVLTTLLERKAKR